MTTRQRIRFHYILLYRLSWDKTSQALYIFSVVWLARSRTIEIDIKIWPKVVFIVNYCLILLIYESELTFHSYFIANYFFTFKMLNIVSMTFTKKLLLIILDLLRHNSSYHLRFFDKSYKRKYNIPKYFRYYLTYFNILLFWLKW